MTAQLIDGNALARQIRTDVAGRTAALKARGIQPALSIVLVGEDPASQVYTKHKVYDSTETGLQATLERYPATIAQSELLARIDTLNQDPAVHGILVQLPLPKHLDSNAVIEAISPAKDVDGFHQLSAGRLFQGRPGLVACTPSGVMRMLEEIGFKPSGKVCVVIGRSNIVGRPMAALLLNASATVVICHSKSDVAAEVKRADLVVAAVGVSRLVKGEWIKPGAVVIDVGMNRGADGKLTGDVEFEAAKERASWITPVPGGVGPMTIAMLMSNTVKAAQV